MKRWQPIHSDVAVQVEGARLAGKRRRTEALRRFPSSGEGKPAANKQGEIKIETRATNVATGPADGALPACKPTDCHLTVVPDDLLAGIETGQEVLGFGRRADGPWSKVDVVGEGRTVQPLAGGAVAGVGVGHRSFDVDSYFAAEA